MVDVSGPRQQETAAGEEAFLQESWGSAAWGPQDSLILQVVIEQTSHVLTSRRVCNSNAVKVLYELIQTRFISLWYMFNSI